MSTIRFLILGFGLFLFGSCEKTDATIVTDTPTLIGYWQFDDYTGPNQQAYVSVPSDAGLDIPEKSMMLEFQEEGVFRQFFWNWCGTPPAIPSGWRYGTWEVVSDEPLRLRLQWDEDSSFEFFYEIITLTDAQLVIRLES